MLDRTSSLPLLTENKTFEGREPDPALSRDGALKLPASHNFLLLWHPLMFDVAMDPEKGGALVVPRLRPLSFEPGVAGVEAIKNEFDGNPAIALTIAVQRGFNIVPPTGVFEAFGRTYKNYVRRLDGYRGPVHMLVWRRPVNRGQTVQTDFDTVAWNRWRASLIGTVIPVPAREVLQGLRIDLTTLQHSLSASALKSPRAGALSEVVEERVDALGDLVSRAAGDVAASSARRLADPPPVEPVVPRTDPAILKLREDADARDVQIEKIHTQIELQGRTLETMSRLLELLTAAKPEPPRRGRQEKPDKAANPTGAPPEQE